jgi:hypothetical protein
MKSDDLYGILEDMVEQLDDAEAGPYCPSSDRNYPNPVYYNNKKLDIIHDTEKRIRNYIIYLANKT